MLAISMQKLDPQYAGLADSYYLAAMAYMEDVIRPKDIKTLQCLVLIAQYSLLTPTRTAVYYIVGLATRLCQQLGLTEEKTITQGVSLGLVNPLQLDMRRRLYWIVLSMEFGLAHSMGRPNAFATGQDHVDVKFFEPVDDEYIKTDGILQGPPSEKKCVAIHFFRMRLLQAEIRQVLYQRKRAEPKDESHPWYAQMEQKLKGWIDACPQNPGWSKPWYAKKKKLQIQTLTDIVMYRFISRYNTMVVFLFRPSPQVPTPSVRSAMMCYDAVAQNIKTQNKQVDTAMVDITWIFLLTVFMAVNTILWTISYPEVRTLHPKDELEEHIDVALEIIAKCRERWPGTAAASRLYSKLAKACLRSYDTNENSHPPSSLSANSPSSLTEANSPSASEHSSATTGSLTHSQNACQSPPQFGYIFDQLPEQIPAFDYSSGLQPPQPSFRSNSIFSDPSSMHSDRRFSYFPPDFTQPQILPNAWNSQAGVRPQSQIQPPPMPPPMVNSAIADPSYFMQPTPFSFGPHMYANEGYDTEMRSGSLSQQQQIELMQSLETEGLTEIDNFINLSYENPNSIKS